MKKRDLYYERIPTKLLREDFRLLGTFLGKVIKDQEGKIFFNIVEKFRLLSKNTLRDKNKSKIFSKISTEVKKLSPENTLKLTRAFSHILNLLNLAESLDASRKLNEYENPYFKNKNYKIKCHFSNQPPRQKRRVFPRRLYLINLLDYPKNLMKGGGHLHITTQIIKKGNILGIIIQ